MTKGTLLCPQALAAFEYYLINNKLTFNISWDISRCLRIQHARFPYTMHEYLETDDIIDSGHAMTSVVHSTMTMPHQQLIITLDPDREVVTELCGPHHINLILQYSTNLFKLIRVKLK